MSVAILQQGLDALEKAQESGDEEAIKEAQQLIEMSKALWDMEQGDVQTEGVEIEH